jgi:neutral ceramidase
MYLEDRSGERIAIVSVDLGESSIVLHRRVAERIREITGVGADRLLLSATHTHSGPSHYFGMPAYDELGSGVSAYDAVLVDTLVARITRAVVDAYRTRERARAAWGLVPIWGLTRIRSFPAYERNIGDARAALRSRFAPRFIDGGIGDLPRAVHLFVNGGHGDVSPNVSEASRCPTPRLVREDGRRGPRGASFETTWRVIQRDVSRDGPCVPLALQELERISDGITSQARSLYDRLGVNMTEDFTVQSAFTVLEVGREEVDGGTLCKPAVGAGTVIGAEDGWTRYRWDWELLMTDSATYSPLPAAPELVRTRKCQGPKRRFLGKVQWAAAGNHALPRHVQLSLVRLGPIALTVTPAEPTSHSSWTIRRAAATALFGERSSADSVLMMSLTNGYNQYLATPDEYPLQLYEGTATIYGPTELTVFTQAFRRLAGQIMRRAPNVLSPARDTITAWRWKTKTVTHWDDHPDPSTNGQPWRDLTVTVRSREVRVHWIGPSPSAFYTSNGPTVFFESGVGNGWRAVAWDNLPEVEVRVTRLSDGFGEYEATWSSKADLPAELRVRLTYRGMQTCNEIGRGPGAC